MALVSVLWHRVITESVLQHASKRGLVVISMQGNSYIDTTQGRIQDSRKGGAKEDTRAKRSKFLGHAHKLLDHTPKSFSLLYAYLYALAVTDKIWTEL